MNKKFAVIGTGFIFRAHLLAIKQIGGEVVDAVNESNGKDLWKEIVKETEADYVVILTPNDLHFEMSKFSSDLGKTVLCEKPFVIKSKDARNLVKCKKVFNVLQLRYHPFLEQIRKKQLSKNIKHEVKMNIYFKRDEDYYVKSWKNQTERSGGFLFNLGAHYFDLLLYLFGNAKKVEVDKIYEKNDEFPEAEAIGRIEGENYACEWQMYINKRDGEEIIKKREFMINGIPYNFSSKNNLAEENLHKFVYQDLLEGKGVKPEEALKSIELIEKIYENENFKK